ncbi:MAG: hypothetical protein ACRDJW_26050, partial [Thermomicrobiales bacterium]
RLPTERWLFLDLGATYVALYPLALTSLGDDLETPISLHQEDDSLRIAIANYDGPARHFWKYAVIPWEHPEPGIAPFFNGNLRAGLVVETADADAWDDFAAFRRAIAGTQVADTVDDTVRRVSVARDGRRLDLAVDLMTFAPIERRIDGEPEAYVFLDAPHAVQLGEKAMRTGDRTVQASRPGPWAVVDGETFQLTNPTPETITVQIDETALEIPPFGRTTCEGLRGAV